MAQEEERSKDFEEIRRRIIETLESWEPKESRDVIVHGPYIKDPTPTVKEQSDEGWDTYPWSRGTDPEDGLAGERNPEGLNLEERDWYTRFVFKLFPVRKIGQDS